MAEPTYEYIKGQGWVASLNHNYYVVFHPGDHWQNAINRGYVFSSYKEAQDHLDKELPYFNDRHPTWKFKIIPADGSEGKY